MGGLMLPCSKGCGESISVTDEMIQEAIAKGRSLEVQHEVCPNEPGATKRNFRITIDVHEIKTETIKAEGDGEDVVTEVPDLLASVGSTVEAGSFVGALPKLQTELNERWEKVVQMASMVDQDVPQATDSAPDQQG